jgi:hypothetical protein
MTLYRTTPFRAEFTRAKTGVTDSGSSVPAITDVNVTSL